MFGNFLYFIVALLIYATYQPTAATRPPLLQTTVLFFSLAFFFFLLTWVQFKKIERRIGRLPLKSIDAQFHTTLTRQSILALVVYAIDIYGLNISSYLSGIRFFTVIPTLAALLFLFLFVVYLAIVWAVAYGAYRRIYDPSTTRREYVFSNISFSIPILLPWLVLSGIEDLVMALPYGWPKTVLESTGGQIAYFLLFLLLIAVAGPALIQWFWGCKPLKEGFVRYRIEYLCQKAGLTYKEIMIWPLFGGKMITAGVMGLVRRFRYILVTPALLAHLEPDEIDAVVAHEIGHVKQRHLIYYFIFFIAYLVVAYASFDLLIYSIMYLDLSFAGSPLLGSAGSSFGSIVFGIAMIAIFLVYFRYVFGYFMRNFERQADIYVYSLMDSAIPLISTFYKIAATSGQSPDRPNWHHFSISQRIDYLKKCEDDRSWIARHHRKIKKSLLVYLAAMVLIGGAGYYISTGPTRQVMTNSLLEKITLEQIQNHPENSQLYVVLGDIYYQNDNYAKAIRSYRQCLAHDPDNGRALNNLAWVLVTCPDKKLREPETALELAQRAVVQSPAPHVYDTLAECQYVNGYFADAVASAKKALSLATDKKEYYRRQLKKFEAARAKQTMD